MRRGKWIAWTILSTISFLLLCLSQRIINSQDLNYSYHSSLHKTRTYSEPERTMRPINSYTNEAVKKTSNDVPTHSRAKVIDCYPRFQIGSSNPGSNYIALPSIPPIHDCKTFLHARHYPTVPKSAVEAEFPIAFSILVYKQFQQFELLLRALYQPQNLYCVHVDDKASEDFKTKVQKLTSCFKNVFITSTTFNVIWGRISVLQAEISCMSDLLQRDVKWKYFINLTGQEFPLKTNWELVKLLRGLNGSNLVNSQDSEDSWEKFGHRVNNARIYDDFGKEIGLGESKGPLPHGLTFHKGSVHVALSRGMVDYAVNHPVAKDFLVWLEDTRIPDESFFSTLHCAQHLEIPGSEDSVCDKTTHHQMLRLKLFLGGDYECKGKVVRGICVFGVGDLPYIYRNGVKGEAMFANKFMTDFQPLAFNCMNALHEARSKIAHNELSRSPLEEMRSLKQDLRFRA